MVQEALASGANVALLEPGAERVDLMREYSHEALPQRRISAKSRKELTLGIESNPRRSGRDGVALVSAGKQGHLGKKLALPRRVQQHRVVVDCVPDQAHPACLRHKNCKCLVTLAEQALASVEFAPG